MNRYPLWKYVVIAVALVVGLLYTLPNFFGEVPAVQVSLVEGRRSRSTPRCSARVEDALKAAGIAYRGATLDATGIKVRFADPDTQLKAKDALQAKLGDNYIVALNLLSSSPPWLTAIGALPMYLGLDLRGGVHFLLQVDMKAALDKAADRYTTDIRSLLREKKVQYAGIAREGTNVVVRFRDAAERDKARAEIEKTFADLLLRDADAAGGELRLVATLKPEAQKRIQDGAIQQNITILRNRVNELGVAEPIIQQQGADRVVVQLPGVQDTARAKDILGRTATLEIRMVDDDPGALERRSRGQVPFGSDLFTERSGAPVLVQAAGRADRRPHHRRAARLRPAHQRARRARQPRRHRRAHLQGGHARERRQADGDRAGREGQGRGHHRAGDPRGDRRRPRPDHRPHDHARGQRHRAADARRRAGGADGDHRGAHRRPVARHGEHRQGLQLGARTASPRSRSSCAPTTCCSALISTIALAVNLLLLVAMLSMLQATLTLPGIAAIALTLGMAIDANVLINERIREELRWGATPQAAIHGRLRARLGHDPRLERHHADRRPRAADLRLRARCAASRSSTASAS